MICVLLFVVAALPAQGQNGTFPQDWVVKEFVAARTLRPGEVSSVSAAECYGDPIGTGRASYSYAEGSYVTLGSTPLQTTFSLVQSGQLDRVSEKSFAPYTNPVGLGGQYKKVSLLLRSGSALLFGSPSRYYGFWPAFWRLTPFSFYGAATGITQPAQLYRAGDLDADGTDDFFYWGYDIPNDDNVFGAMSGATLTPMWERVATKGLVSTNLHVELGPPPDLDGDSVPDLVAGVIFPNAAISAYEQYLHAYSGADGSTIWNRNLGSQGPGFSTAMTYGPDFTGDGIGDAVMHGGYDLRAVDGATGSVLWTVSHAQLMAHRPGWSANVYFGFAPTIQQRAGAPGEWDIVVPLLGQEPNFIDESVLLCTVDAATGQITHMDDLPDDLQPWAPDPVLLHTGTHFSIGDLDRDGLKEYAITVETPSNTAPGTGSAVNYSMAIFGRKTLDVPATAGLGSTFTLRTANATAAGKPFVVLASTAFDAGGGRRLAFWRTHLAPSPLLTHTLTQRPLSGVLDGSGIGSVPVTVPSHPSWVGETIYLKAVVLDTPAATEPYSISTLGIVEIVP